MDFEACVYICLYVCIYIRGIVPPNLLSQSISSINIHIPISPKPALIPIQGLIQKEKVDTDGEKSAQISIVVKKTVTQRWLQIMIMEPKQANITIILIFFSVLCSCYVTDMIKKLELCLLVVIIWFNIEFGHTQISVPKIGKPMLKTACINPCYLSLHPHPSSHHYVTHHLPTFTISNAIHIIVSRGGLSTSLKYHSSHRGTKSHLKKHSPT